MDPVHIDILSTWVLKDIGNDLSKLKDKMAVYPAFNNVESRHTVVSAVLVKMSNCNAL